MHLNTADRKICPKPNHLNISKYAYRYGYTESVMQKIDVNRYKVHTPKFHLLVMLMLSPQEFA